MKYLLKVLCYILFNAMIILFSLHFLTDGLIQKSLIVYSLIVSGLMLIPDNYYATESIIPKVIYEPDQEVKQWMIISTLIS